MSIPVSHAAAKQRAAGLSIASNAALVVLKVAGGLVTGSVAILSDGVQSTMDLVASLITFWAVRQADVPADDTHRYGHEKLEDVSAGIEAMLLLAGATLIAVQAIRRLVNGGHDSSLGAGVGVVAVAAVANLVVSTYLLRAARRTSSAALAADGAHLRTDAAVSFGVLVALIIVKATGQQWVDPAVGLCVAATITVTGVRILSDSARRLIDETLPAAEMAELEHVVQEFVGPEVVGYHDLRARHVGNRHEVDLHLQFAEGTSLKDAHAISHRLQHAVTGHLPDTAVLVHLEPEDRVRADRFTELDS